MDKHRKVLEIVLRASADANISFRDLRALLGSLGFSERVRGVILTYNLGGDE